MAVTAPEAEQKPKRTRKPKEATAESSGMTQEHKDALAEGREHGRIVRRYLEALEAHKPKRGRKRTVENMTERLEAVEEALATSNALDRVHFIQEKHDLEAALSAQDEDFDLSGYEDAFIAVAAAYSERKGLSYTAWREVGISPVVLKQAGITRSG